MQRKEEEAVIISLLLPSPRRQRRRVLYSEERCLFAFRPIAVGRVPELASNCPEIVELCVCRPIRNERAKGGDLSPLVYYSRHPSGLS